MGSEKMRLSIHYSKEEADRVANSLSELSGSNIFFVNKISAFAWAVHAIRDEMSTIDFMKSLLVKIAKNHSESVR